MRFNKYLVFVSFLFASATCWAQKLSFGTSTSLRNNFYNIEFYDQDSKKHLHSTTSFAQNIKATYTFSRVAPFVELKMSRSNFRINTENSTSYKGSTIKTENNGYGVGELHIGILLPILDRRTHQLLISASLGFLLPSAIFNDLNKFDRTSEPIDDFPYTIEYRHGTYWRRVNFNHSVCGGVIEKIKLSDRATLDIFASYNHGFVQMYETHYSYWFPNTPNIEVDGMIITSNGSYLETGVGLTFAIQKANQQRFKKEALNYE